MKIRGRILREIEYGVQCELAYENERALLNYYCASKKRTLYIQKASSGAFRSLIAQFDKEIKCALDQARAHTDAGDFCIEPLALFQDIEPPAPEKRQGEGDPQEHTLFTEDVFPASMPEKRHVPDGEYALFTDGGASPNPGAGAAAWLVRDASGRTEEGARYFPKTTNNRMELLAVIEGLAHIPPGASVAIDTDSQYVQNGMSRWILSWKKNSWQTKNKTDVANRDLWERLDALSSAYRIAWHWVRGHSGHPENERCDALVREARRRQEDILPPA